MAIPHKCPVCEGQGTVSRPAHIDGDVKYWYSDGAGGYVCPACHGTGIVWEDRNVAGMLCTCYLKGKTSAVITCAIHG